jgi:hypothetical protein
VERVKGIEPSYAAWEAAVLPLNYTRVALPSLTRTFAHRPTRRLHSLQFTSAGHDGAITVPKAHFDRYANESGCAMTRTQESVIPAQIPLH